MPEIDSKTLTELFDLLRSDPAELSRELRLLIENAPELPKTRKAALKIILQKMDKADVRSSRLLVEQGQLDLAESKIAAGLASKQIGGEQKIAEIGARTASQEAVIGARAEAKGTAKLAEGLADIKVEQAKAEVVETGLAPARVALNATRDRISLAIEKPGPINVTQITAQIGAIPDEGLPELTRVKSELTNLLQAKQLQATTSTRVLAAKKGITDPQALQLLDQVADRRAFKLTSSARDAPHFQIAEQTQAVRLSQGPALQSAGLRLLSEPSGAAGGASLQRTNAFPGFGKAGVPEAEGVLNMVEKALSESQPGKAGGLLKTLGSALKGGIGKRAGLVGAGAGGLLALLLPSLLRGGSVPQGLPPALQIQLMQQLAQLQQQQQLTGSLVQSRGASAQRDTARAALLRLQAAQAAGGGSPLVV